MRPASEATECVRALTISAHLGGSECELALWWPWLTEFSCGEELVPEKQKHMTLEKQTLSFTGHHTPILSVETLATPRIISFQMLASPPPSVAKRCSELRRTPCQRWCFGLIVYQITQIIHKNHTNFKENGDQSNEESKIPPRDVRIPGERRLCRRRISNRVFNTC